MKNNIKDERVVAEKRKIQSDAFQFILLYLLTSTIIQQFILRAPIQQYIVEFSAFILGAVYILVMNIKLGDEAQNLGFKGKNLFIGSLINATVISLSIYFVTGEGNIKSLILAFVVSFVVYFAINLLIRKISNKRIEKLEKDLDD